MNPPTHLGIKVDEDQKREEEEEERGELVEREALAEYSVEVSVKCLVSYPWPNIVINKGTKC